MAGGSKKIPISEPIETPPSLEAPTSHWTSNSTEAPVFSEPTSTGAPKFSEPTSSGTTKFTEPQTARGTEVNEPGEIVSTNINTVTGGGASKNNIAIQLQNQIQKLADKWQVEISVIGSRAKGKAHRESDWDYIVNSDDPKVIRDLKKNLPKSPVSRAEMGRDRLEVFKQSSHPLRESEPYIKFIPNNKK